MLDNAVLGKRHCWVMQRWGEGHCRVMLAWGRDIVDECFQAVGTVLSNTEIKGEIKGKDIMCGWGRDIVV